MLKPTFTHLNCIGTIIYCNGVKNNAISHYQAILI
jgi:hypothetical protein